MKQKIPPVWFLTILYFGIGCKDSLKTSNMEALSEQKQSKGSIPITDTHKTISKADIYTQAAIETCHCIQPMVEKAKRLKELKANKQRTDMKKVVNEMEQIQPQVQRCSDEIYQKYGKINKDIDEQRILNALLTECPDMAMLFSNLSK